MTEFEVMGNRADDSKGLGRLGQATVDYEHGIPNLNAKAVSLPGKADILLYARKTSGTLVEALEYSNEHGTPLIFASSGIDISNIPEPQYPLIVASNLDSERVIQFMTAQEAAAAQLPGWIPHITEHHQETKVLPNGDPEPSGTAKQLAAMLGVDESTIDAVRNFSVTQAAYDIPDESRSGYAIHSVTYKNPQTGETIQPIEDVVLRGRQTYAAGAFAIIEAYLANPDAFPPGVLNLVDLVKSGVVKARTAA